MGQGPEALEEVALGMAEGLAVGPGLGPPEDGAEGKDEEVGQGGSLVRSMRGSGRSAKWSSRANLDAVMVVPPGVLAGRGP